MIEQEDQIIFFDGLCNLCNSSVQFIIKRDSKLNFKFASLQSEFAKTCLGEEFSSSALKKGVVLKKGDRIFTASSAALQIARKLDGLWPLLFCFYFIPKFFRDWVYGWIANNRNKIWGKKEECWVPTPEIAWRFIDQPIL
ncbi:thiol-disulfide oxidoreductase DCC family protein [Pedobacter flavus]|uniref:DCC1-like thiol-disulfide oxidoreductase family protein n=1 Tax=Pedobacter flavus TaxID=3113906 RepID=A0ABU7H4R4_9SPHI|nr:DCC1-like thiol-disulfide oxidoreductase family protein [Pedobacter sp. VNH31]MEE1885983.1 DCC1-like thiol-disulfide oxidoreductase family protein [Pedobacter sp. VNH31]